MKLTHAEWYVLQTASPDGFVTAEKDGVTAVARNLEAKGLLKHRHGLVYALTPAGKIRLESLRGLA